MKEIVFLDIEGTLIEEFENPTMLMENFDRVSALLQNATHIFCFSWAVNNESDFKKRKTIIENIETSFKLKFNSIIFRDNMFPVFKEIFGSGLDFNEFEDLCRSLGKETVFQIYVRKMLSKGFKDSECVTFTLIDDRVEDTSLTVKQGNKIISIETVKI